MPPPSVILRHPLIFLTVFFCSHASPVPAQPAGKQTGEGSNDVVEMEQFSVSAAKFRWWYARSEHFEIIVNTDRLKWIPTVIEKTEQMIALMESRCPLYRMQDELPIKLIYITDAGLERFDKHTGNHTSIWNKYSRTAKLQGSDASRFPSAFKKSKEQRIILKPTESAHREMPLDRHSLHANSLFRNYILNCVSRNDLKLFARDNLATMVLTAAHTPNFETYSTFNAFSYPRTKKAFEIGPFDISDGKIIRMRYFEKAAVEGIVTSKAYLKIPAKDRWPPPDMIYDVYLRRPRLSLKEVLESPLTPSSIPRESSVDERVKHILHAQQLSDFVGYCIHGPNRKASEGFANFILAARKQPINESLFKQCFGVSYKAFHDEMYSFYRNLGKNNRKYKNSDWGPPAWVVHTFEPKIILNPIELSPAQRHQTARIISDWFSLNNRADLARKTLLAAEKETPWSMQNPDFQAALGLHEFQQGNKAGALVLLKKATAANVERPEAYRVLSRLLLEDILNAKGKDYKLAEPEYSDVIKPLLAAAKHPIPSPETYFQIIDMLKICATEPPAEHFETLVKNCVAFYPDNLDLLEQLIPLLVKHKQQQAVTTLLGTARKCVLSPGETIRLEKLSAI